MDNSSLLPFLIISFCSFLILDILEFPVVIRNFDIITNVLPAALAEMVERIKNVNQFLKRKFRSTNTTETGRRLIDTYISIYVMYSHSVREKASQI